MGRDINLKRLCQREPARTLLTRLMALSPEPLSLYDGDGTLILQSAGQGLDPPARVEVLIPTGDGPGIPARVTGGSQAGLLADWVTFILQKEQDSRELARDTLSKYKELSLLYELGEKIAACVDAAELATLTLTEARALLPRADDLALGILTGDESLDRLRVQAGEGDRFEPGQTLAVIDGITRQVLAGGAAELVNRPDQDARFQASPGLLNGIQAMLCVPLKTRDRVLGVLLVVSERETAFNAAALKVLNLLASQVGLALGRIRLIEARVEQERLEESLRLSRAIQTSLLPGEFPRFGQGSPVDLYACMEPARQVGGDFYDFFPLDEHTLLLVIGDVSDKGMAAALFMVMVRTLIRANAPVCRLPQRILSTINPELCRDNDALMFVTLFVATLNTQTGQLTYSLAGHNPPLVLGRDGSVQWLPGDSGTALGIVESARFCTRTTTLGPGDGLILYTDGISEALNSQLEEFGEARLMALLQNRARLDAAQLVEIILQAVQGFTLGAEQSDDFTLLAVRRGD